MKKHLALEYLLNSTWALDERLLTAMGDIASRDIKNIDFSDLENSESFSKYNAVMAKDGQLLGKCSELREGGVAVIHANGVISRYASWFHSICGGTSTQLIAKEFNAALINPQVRSIVLNIDSPGGQADGIHELSEMIFDARGQKPIISYVGGMSASAAYWIGSAADEMVIDATAEVGSIGVVATLRRRKNKDDDFEQFEFVSSQSPRKRLDPGSKEGREDWQERIDQMADVFIDKIARNMAVKRSKVLSDFGQGGIFMGKKAVTLGMAKRLGSLEGVIKQLSAGNNSVTISNPKAAVINLPAQTEASADVLIGAIKEQRPDVFQALEALKIEPAMALDHAGEIVTACTAAGFPELSASLLGANVTKASADKQILAAGGLKDICAAAGLDGSASALLAYIDDPVKLAGAAIHEAQAVSDESSKIQGQILGKDVQKAKINGTAIMANRKVKR